VIDSRILGANQHQPGCAAKFVMKGGTMKTFLVSALVTVLLAVSAYAADGQADRLISKALASGKPTLVDFGAGYCIPCKKMKPILDSLSQEYRGRANVLFVDIKQERDIPGKYHIQLIPTQVFFDAKGRETKRHMGFMDKPEIISEFKQLGVK
jgi:thioredoxin 1